MSPAGAATCAFCRIVDGSAPAWVVIDDELVLAFLDHRPLFHGHCLLVPRAHAETLADLPADLLEPLFGAARRLTVALERIGFQGSFVAINNRVSQSVPHLHVHVVPRRFKDGLRGFFWPRQRYDSDAAMDEMRRAIIAALPRR